MIIDYVLVLSWFIINERTGCATILISIFKSRSPWLRRIYDRSWLYAACKASNINTIPYHTQISKDR